MRAIAIPTKIDVNNVLSMSKCNVIAKFSMFSPVSLDQFISILPAPRTQLLLPKT